MKINHLPSADPPKPSGARSAAPAAASPAAAAAAPAATVTVSSLARAMESTAIAGSSAATPDFNAEKVAQVRAAIADGSYKVNAGAIADRLLANAQQLLRRNGDDAGAES
ncbi:flagellar biosynthesis anti-sigma factor FlgM [Xylophilus sp. ASV27]|uniref:flagellar biosynthesis anti-sigma factor FlgM n=1 Tax=Xylophilus sp. ASV27 TaxID=2795129 RepID=UPI0018ECE05F|nr:flagellar biosynthesis anti-sigma factor FlgM [Xylophilus sp. ASV27]